MGRPFNWARHQEGKEANKNGIIDEISFRIYSVVVNVNDVGQAMKGIKRNSDR